MIFSPCDQENPLTNPQYGLVETFSVEGDRVCYLHHFSSRSPETHVNRLHDAGHMTHLIPNYWLVKGLLTCPTSAGRRYTRLPHNHYIILASYCQPLTGIMRATPPDYQLPQILQDWQSAR